jgi:beta-lactamase regulating signal transducer with metallopeptidase domain
MIDLARAVLVLYLAGATVLLGLLARSVILLSRMVRSARRVAGTDCRRRLLTGLDHRGWRLPDLVESAACAVPFVWRSGRPVLVLPATSQGWSGERLEAVFLHELAHLRQHDVPLRLAAEVMCACHWFNPLAWLAARRLRAEGEAACDDAVLAAGMRPELYAAELLGLGVERRWHLRAAGAMAGGSPLGRRVRAVLDAELPRQPAGGVLRGSIVAGVVGMLAVLAALRPAVAGPTSLREIAGPAQAPPVASPDITPLQFRWSDGAATGVLFTEGPVDLDGRDLPAIAPPGFLLIVHRDHAGVLRSARASSHAGTASERFVRDGDGLTPWSTLPEPWLDAAIEVAGSRLGGQGRHIRWRGAPLATEGDRVRDRSVSGSVMTGLPASSEDSGRGVLAAGWERGGERVGIFGCAAPGHDNGATAARELLRRIWIAHGATSALEADECIVAFTWERSTGTLTVLEAYRVGAAPARVHLSVDHQAVPIVAAAPWLAGLLQAALSALEG